MFDRRLFPILEAHLAERFVTVLTGMRRVGKSTALRFLLAKIEHSNKLFLDLERVEIRHLFLRPSYREIQTELEILGLDFSRPAVLALDEIQLVPPIASVIKYFYDTFDVKFLVTGSSSFYLKNQFSESLAGRKHVFEMFPLDFREFLVFRGETDFSALERFRFQPFQVGIFQKYSDLYAEFLRFGGFPEVVLTANFDSKKRTISDVVNSYIDLDVRLVADFEAGAALFNLVRLLASRTGSLLDATAIGSILGLSRAKTTGYLELLEKTYFIRTAVPFSRSVDREISKRRKIYFADTGILNELAAVNSGQLLENAVFLQLQRLGEVQFYQKKSGQEIDFILDQKAAVEVKETPHAGDLRTLHGRAASLDLPEKWLVGQRPPGDGFGEFVWAGTIF